MSIKLQFKDLEYFEPISGKNDGYAGAIKNQTSGADIILTHPKAGRVGFTSIGMPHLQILHMDWRTGSEQITVHGHEPLKRSVGISFQISGYMSSKFKGIKNPLEMKKGRHNLIFTPEVGDEHQFSTNESVSALQMNMDEDYFKFCIGTDDSWSEGILRNLEERTPFSAVDHSAATTPQMAQLIDLIVNNKIIGPMRNLMIQSHTLELLALQFNQFRSAGNVSEIVSKTDHDKFQSLKNYIDSHFLQDLSLTQLSRNFYINEFKLKKGFKTIFGYTVFGYVRKLRMDYALLQLRFNANSVDEVAYSLGYENSNHFSTAFKNYFGKSPSVYLKKKL